MCSKFERQKGFSLVETIVGVGIFLIVATAIYHSYSRIIEAVTLARQKISAIALATEQLEIIRNLSYDDVGIISGIPSGKIPRTQTVTRDNIPFTITTTIRNIDDPFDGTIGGTPNDLSPADYKLVEVEISCEVCLNFKPLRFNAYVAPKGLETSSTNGALFIKVFDAMGQPVKNANVHIENNQLSPPITIDEVTDNNGLLQIIDAPPGIEAYEISVSKPSYSQDKTYSRGEENPNPAKPHATVTVQQITEISFAIDKISTLNVLSSSNTCSPIGYIDFIMKGSKLIGTNPNILKYNETHYTNSSGEKIISDLEWDTYNFSLNDESYDLAGTIPSLPLNLNPGANQDLRFVVSLKKPKSLLVTIKDATSQLPVSDATVSLVGENYEKSLNSGQGTFTQEDWSGGSGQEAFTDPTRYFESTGIEISNPEGEIKLSKIGDYYISQGFLISSTFDTGSPSNFHQINWEPKDQPPQCGENSVKFQIATNNDNETWEFLGPDGTSNTFYTLSEPMINPIHNNKRYLRYKVYLQTEDSSFTPNISKINITFTSQCVPPGQVFFNNLPSGSYELSVSKTGYEAVVQTVNISENWQQVEILLNPNL